MELRSMAASDAELERLGALLQRNGASSTTADLRWRHFDNPTGQTLVDVATDDDRFVGTYAVMGVRMRLGRDRLVAAQSLDTLTDADFRGQGLFNRLATRNYGRCDTAGLALVYGFPNAHSQRGFFGRLNWTRLDPVPFMIRPLSTAAVTNRIGTLRGLAGIPLPVMRPRPGRDTTLEEWSEFDHRVDALWETFAGDDTVGVERDATYLDWRICRHPRFSYRTFAAVSGDALRALCIVRDAGEKHGQRLGYVMELLHGPHDAAAGRAVLDQGLLALRRSGCSAVLSWCLPRSANHRTYLRSGFVPLPERVRPIELHFGARTFQRGRALSIPLTDRDRWYLSYLDADTV